MHEISFQGCGNGEMPLPVDNELRSWGTVMRQHRGKRSWLKTGAAILWFAMVLAGMAGSAPAGDSQSSTGGNQTDAAARIKQPINLEEKAS